MEGSAGRRPLLDVVSFAQLKEHTAVPVARVAASSTHEVSSLLQAWCEGDAKALERLIHGRDSTNCKPSKNSYPILSLFPDSGTAQGKDDAEDYEDRERRGSH